MPQISNLYQCDYPGCTAPDFDLSVGYCFTAFVQMTGATQVSSFMCPSGQHICCSVDHAQQMSAYCATNHLVPSLQDQAAALGTIPVMTPPTA